MRIPNAVFNFADDGVPCTDNNRCVLGSLYEASPLCYILCSLSLHMGSRKMKGGNEISGRIVRLLWFINPGVRGLDSCVFGDHADGHDVETI
jgi:hypothetical protein